MPGQPWDDLEEQMEKRALGGTAEAARAHWGKWSSKLETVLLVAVPSEANRNLSRILPGREDVYIIPRADCIPGSDADSNNAYYSCKNIKACLVLKPPANQVEIEPQLSAMSRVQCSTEYDEKGMSNLQLSPSSDEATTVDISDTSEFPPKITQFTMSIAHSSNAQAVVKAVHHSVLQPTFSSQQLWIEDVARFKAAEMTAGVVGVEQLLTQAYTMAYYYTTIEHARTICERGIPTVSHSGMCSLTVCLLPPSAEELRWQSNAGGGFKQRVANLLGLDVNDVQAIVLLGIPTCAIELEECAGQVLFTLREPAGRPTFLQQQQTEGGATTVYSKAHIAKVWSVEATAVADARQALLDVRAGKTLHDAFAGKTEAHIEHDISELLLKESTAAAPEEEPEEPEREIATADLPKEEEGGMTAVDEAVPPDGTGTVVEDTSTEAQHTEIAKLKKQMEAMQQQMKVQEVQVEAAQAEAEAAQAEAKQSKKGKIVLLMQVRKRSSFLNVICKTIMSSTKKGSVQTL